MVMVMETVTLNESWQCFEYELVLGNQQDRGRSPWTLRVIVYWIKEDAAQELEQPMADDYGGCRC